MPLSKKRNRERMRGIRLHKQVSSPHGSKPVQPRASGPGKEIIDQGITQGNTGYDADGYPIYEE